MQKVLLIILLVLSAVGFTQNHTDANGNKQGKWTFEVLDTIQYQTITPTSIGDIITEYKTYNKLEGEYLDNKKIGVWTSRDSYNHILSTVTYQKDKPVGEVKVFYRHGIRYKGVITLDSKIVELETKAESGKFWTTIKMDIDELIEKWTFIEEY